MTIGELVQDVIRPAAAHALREGSGLGRDATMRKKRAAPRGGVYVG
jgi:hypothetical protein